MAPRSFEYVSPNADARESCEPASPEDAFERAAASHEYIERNIEHAHALAARLNAALDAVLHENAVRGDRDAEMFHAAEEQLATGRIARRQARFPRGRNHSVEPCIVEQHGHEPIYAFKKSLVGGFEVFLHGERIFVVNRTLRNGESRASLAPASTDLLESCDLTPDAIRRAMSLDAQRRPLLGARYDINANRLPHRTNPLGTRPVDNVHELASARSVAALSHALRLYAAPPTQLRGDDPNGPLVLQCGVRFSTDGHDTRDGLPHTNERLKRLVHNGERDEQAPGFANVALLQFLANETDGGRLNLLDGGTRPWSIDNGCAFQHTIRRPGASAPYAEAFRPAWPYRSFAWNLTNRLKLPIPDETLDRLNGALQRIAAFVAEQRDPMDTEKEPPAIITCLNAITRLAYERVDERGRVIKETTKIAEAEFALLIAKLEYVVTHRRLPNFQLPTDLEQHRILADLIPANADDEDPI